MAQPIFRYPLDKTGVNPDNFVNREQHSLTPVNRPTDVRVAAPKYGPFFADAITVRDRSNGITLVKGADYKVTDLLQDPTLSFGKEIGQFIVIMNPAVTNEIDISYQVLGGNYQNDATAVQHVFQTFLNDTRPVDWNDISGKPTTFPPSLHIHLLDDIIGWGPVIVALEQVRDAILLNNTPMFEAMIDWVNERPTPWSKITGKPTNGGDWGFTDIVFTNRRINTPPSGGLKGGGDLTQDLSLSIADTAVVAGTYGSNNQIPVFAVNSRGQLTRVDTVAPQVAFSAITNRPTTLDGYGIIDGVKNTRRILTPVAGGLQGGNDLQQDVSLSLSDTGVLAGIYGGSGEIPVLNIDLKGRVKAVHTVKPSVLVQHSRTINAYGDGAGTPISGEVRLSTRTGNRLTVESDGLGVFDQAPPDIATQFIDAVFGDDNGPGTFDRPLKTLAHAIWRIANAGAVGQFSISLKSGQTHIVDQGMPELSSAELVFSTYGEPKYQLGQDPWQSPPGYYCEFAPDFRRAVLDFRRYIPNTEFPTYLAYPIISAKSITAVGVRFLLPNGDVTYPGGAWYVLSTENSGGRVWVTGSDIVYRTTTRTQCLARAGQMVLSSIIVENMLNNLHTIGDSCGTFLFSGDAGWAKHFEAYQQFPAFDGRLGNLVSTVKANMVSSSAQVSFEQKKIFGFNINYDIFA